MTRFNGKVALVTGGRSGIGRAIADRLRGEGARVFTAQRGEDREFEGLSVDFADPAAASAAVNDIIERAGRLDVLINNAGMMQEALVEEMSLEDWTRNLTVNLTTPFMLIKAQLRNSAPTVSASPVSDDATKKAYRQNRFPPQHSAKPVRHALSRFFP